ncbi:hypothetical protein PHYPSEUDO_012107 [Phytophthora pseudosyringae]|uniref:Uncharacterized protein n=1 Tax=Phytophthora pseudosyringae TaxID=221518 RepID=A0A8T1W5R8_9STRA|nr:hypothetical protein PHYPSEUDO_012107 [Phytophthora pseudosyringae]
MVVYTFMVVVFCNRRRVTRCWGLGLESPTGIDDAWWHFALGRKLGNEQRRGEHAARARADDAAGERQGAERRGALSHRALILPESSLSVSLWPARLMRVHDDAYGRGQPLTRSGSGSVAESRANREPTDAAAVWLWPGRLARQAVTEDFGLTGDFGPWSPRILDRSTKS